MAQLIVRRFGEDVVAKLKKRAKRHGRSMEDEVRHILRDAAKDEAGDVRNLGSRIAQRFRTVGRSSELRELRQPLLPVRLDE